MAQPKIGDLDSGGLYLWKSATAGTDLPAALADEPDAASADCRAVSLRTTFEEKC